MSTSDSVMDAVSKLLLRDALVKAPDKVPEQVLLTKRKQSTVKSFSCKKSGHYLPDCQ